MMARKRRGRLIHGWVPIDKPKGWTSSQVTSKARRILDASKAGHGGTLDPMATGVLPIAFGEATKTVSYVMNGKKRYRFTVSWGEERTTDDLEGEIKASSCHRPTKQNILTILPEFIGTIEQVPPDFSAIKVAGERAYNLARTGEEIFLSKRKVVVDEFCLLETPDKNHAIFEVLCGKGTYIRSLARDIARRLDTVGYVSQLRRTQCGPFSEKHSISLETLQTLVHSAPPSAYLLDVEAALDDIPALTLNQTQADHLRHGRPVRVQNSGGRSFLETSSLVEGDVFCAMADGKPVALARFADGEIRAVRVLNVYI